jgi:ketosteroid isomerase-like protein
MDETVWHLLGRSSMAGDYDGRGATLAYFSKLAQETGGSFRAELQHMAADGEDCVVGIQRSTADRNGKHLDVANCIVFELSERVHVARVERVVSASHDRYVFICGHREPLRCRDPVEPLGD